MRRFVCMWLNECFRDSVGGDPSYPVIFYFEVLFIFSRYTGPAVILPRTTIISAKSIVAVGRVVLLHNTVSSWLRAVRV